MEVRIAGVNLPINKHVVIALTSIFGIGRTRAEQICADAAVDSTTKVMKLDEGQIEKLRSIVGRHTIEGELRREVAFNIKRKIDINCYEGIRHKRGLPLRQRTKTNARTRKGKRKPVRK